MIDWWMDVCSLSEFGLVKTFQNVYKIAASNQKWHKITTTRCKTTETKSDGFNQREKNTDAKKMMLTHKQPKKEKVWINKKLRKITTKGWKTASERSEMLHANCWKWIKTTTRRVQTTRDTKWFFLKRKKEETTTKKAKSQ